MRHTCHQMPVTAPPNVLMGDVETLKFISLKTPVCLWFPRSPLSSPGHVQFFALGFPNQCLRPALPWPLPHAYIISSPSALHPTMQTLPPYCTHYVEHSKYLLEKGEKWFAHGCPRPPQYHLSPEPFPTRVPFQAYLYSDAHPQLGLGGKDRSPAQEYTSHSGSTARHRGPWSAHSTGRRWCCHTCSWPPRLCC